MFWYSIKYLLFILWTNIQNLFYFIRFYLKKDSLFSNPPINSIEKQGWELTFQDEFDGDEIDFENHWNKWYSENTMHDPEHIGCENTLDCLELKDGKLHMWTKDNPDSEYALKTGLLYSASVKYWKDGQLLDKFFDQQYGYFEIRCKPPKQGLMFWPAFWLYGSKWPPEIDIFEFMSGSDVGKDYTKGISMTTHWGNQGKKGMGSFLGTQLGRTLNGIDWSADFHTYACRWEWDYIEWYIDNTPVYKTVFHVPDIPMSIVVNNGGHLKHLPSEEDLPADFVVDYIRAYKRIVD